MKPRPTKRPPKNIRRLPRNARSFAEGGFVMSIAAKLRAHLARKQIDFDIAPHRRTTDAMSSAEAGHISPDCLAKGVVVRASDGYFLAVLPASQRISPLYAAH